MRRFLLALLLFGMGIAPVGSATETLLPAVTNLARQAALTARQGAPLIVLVSLAGCTYCEKIRRQHLAPMEASGVVIQQVFLDSETGLVDFDGKQTTQRRFAKSQDVKFAPTVLFFGAKGERLAEPIVGALIDDFYSAVLDDAIAAATKQLALHR